MADCTTSISVDLIAAALAGIDDTTVLLDERPVAVADLWRRVISASVEPHCRALTVVHPSWWTPHRVKRIVDTAASVVGDVRALPRSAAITDGESATVVEIADDVIAVSGAGRSPLVLARTDDPREVARTIGNDSGRGILIDAPPGVAGGAEYARDLLTALRQRGVAARPAVVRDVSAPTVAAPSVPSPRRWRGPVSVAASAALTLCALGLTAGRPHTPAPALDVIDIVEGRITVRIPARWPITRITAGRGSRRIQASAPDAPNVALHVTQSYSPGEILDRTAAVLRQAVAEQPRGVFVDFNPADRRGGRPAVTYREVRVGRDIRWTVVLDGATRISIGCQSAPGREDVVAEACERAIESARELVGTDGPT
ncbi:putative alanine and valine rich protein [Mycolicibacterium rhodesiae JS60]|nr:putative alanine and valine rich protein [Mycolicibacterium rhodesiae JS60]